MRFNKTLDDNSYDSDKDKTYGTVSSSSFSQPYFEQTSSSTTNPENRLIHIDTVKVDEKSRLVLTKKAKDVLHIQPKDTIVIYDDRVNNHVILKVQRGANNNNSIVDSWILKRNVLVGYTYGYKDEQ